MSSGLPTKGGMQRNELDFLRFDPVAVADIIPAAKAGVGAVAYVSNGDTGSPCLAVSNGTNWLVVALGSAISAT